MFVQPIFRDRTEAGRILGERLKSVVKDPDVIVLALPRGGVPVAYEVARALNADLDIFLVRKLGVPGHEELAMGAIASGGVRILNQGVIQQWGIPRVAIERVTAQEEEEIRRREQLYREGRPAPAIRGRTVILVDDGLATGATMLAAIRALRAQQPKKIIVAVPVAARETCEELKQEADQMVCIATPEPFFAVGAWYQDFSQTTDDEVRKLLERAAHERVD